MVDSVYNLTTNTPEKETFSVALCSQGQYGIEEGLIFSYPCRVEKGELKVVEGIKHDSFGQEKIDLTHEELKAERDDVKKLGLI